MCSGGKVQVFLGTGSSGAASLDTLLRNQVGDASSMEEAAPEMLSRAHGQFPYCAALTGIPHFVEQQRQRQDQLPFAVRCIDDLIAALIDMDWLFVVPAFPIRRAQTAAWLEQCTREMKDIKDSFLLREMQKSNRMAAHYIEVLEKTVQRLKKGKQQGLWQTGVYFLANRPETARQGAAVLAAIFSGNRSLPEPIRCHLCASDGLSPFLNCFNGGELQSFVDLPKREFPGYRVRESVPFDLDLEQERGASVELGRVLFSERVLPHPCTVPIMDLTKHALVAGVTGSGKTNTILNLLRDLYLRYGVPFMVIEPAKSEYRDLLREIDSLRVFTLGEERPGRSSPFRMNPFAFPEGVSLQTHIDYLKAVFNASFVMYAPMPYVLEDCTYQIYLAKGWDLATSSNRRGVHPGAFPTLSDLYHKIDQVVEDLGYQDRTTMDIKAALKTRIKNLCLGGKGMMLNTQMSIPFDLLMKQPVVLELKYMGSDEEKAFMMGLLLTSLGEYHECSPSHQAGLKHLTVIEEAHRLLKNVPTEKVSEEQSNIKGKGVESFCNLLAEVRAYGEGVLISEQIPTKLAPDVIKNSNLKILHRLVSRDDREIIGDTMNLNSQQKRHVLSLRSGEAIAFREGMDRPVKIRVPLSRAKQLSAPIKTMEVFEHMRDDFYSRHKSLLVKYDACLTCRHQSTDGCHSSHGKITQLLENGSMEQTALKFFLPYVVQPDRGGFDKHLRVVMDVHGVNPYCLSATLLNHYVSSKGDYFQWPFAEMQELKRKAEAAIEDGGFARIVGEYCHGKSVAAAKRFTLCEVICSRGCLYAYEAHYLTKDAWLHNRLVDLLRTNHFGLSFYRELLLVTVDYLRDFFPVEQKSQLHHLAGCFLVHKLNELRFSFPLRQRILAQFRQVLERIETA